MKKSIFTFLLLLILESQELYAQCIIASDAGPDIHTCNNNLSISLHGNGQSLSGQLQFQWWGSSGNFSSNNTQNTFYMLTAADIAAGGAWIVLTVTDPVTTCFTHDTLRIFYGSCPGIGLITGTIFNDLDSNGVQDVGEDGIPNIIVGNGSFGTYTDSDGDYALSVLNGVSTISTYLIHGRKASTSLSYSVTVNSDTVSDYNFGMYLSPNITEVSVDLVSNNPRPGFGTTYILYYANNGSTVASGTIEFKYDPNLTYNGSSPAHTAHENFTKTITYTYTNLQPGERRIIYPSFSLPAVTPLGISLTSSTSITPIVGDAYTINNYDTLRLVSVGSFDPNDKQVIPTGETVDHYIRSTDDLEYTIRFQNTGTADAINVVITDTLENTLNPYSLEMIAASHSYSMDMEENRIVKWIFENIMLPDSNTNEPESHGFVRFKIKQKTGGNAEGTAIRNKAAIYFDFNVPVITNSTLSTIGDNYFLTASVEQNNLTKEDFSIYPNPTSGYLYIGGKFKTLNYQIISGNGSALMEGYYQNGINTSVLQKGIYVLKITTENSIEYKRLVIY